MCLQRAPSLTSTTPSRSLLPGPINHLHRFRIRGKEYGISRRGGPWYSRDARDIRLIDFHFRVNERFLYEYDFTDGWEHQVRIEQLVSPEQMQPYSVCVGGSRAAPPEDCGGPTAFQQRRTHSIASKSATPCRLGNWPRIMVTCRTRKTPGTLLFISSSPSSLDGPTHCTRQY